VSGGQVLGLAVAAVMVVGGGFLALAGMGYVGESSGSSGSWSILGSLLAGLGVALGITVVQGSRRG
jgi:hypothetical protein